jgi:hypothetical protein
MKFETSTKRKAKNAVPKYKRCTNSHLIISSQNTRKIENSAQFFALGSTPKTWQHFPKNKKNVCVFFEICENPTRDAHFLVVKEKIFMHLREEKS